MTHLGSGGFTWLQPDRGGVRGRVGSLMLTFYLWAIQIGQLAFAGNYHWLTTMHLSSSSLAVKFTEWVTWATGTHSASLICTVHH